MAELYPMLKHLHLTAVGLSLLLFVSRGIGMLHNAQWISKKVFRILPHVIDTILLVSALGLTVALSQYPFQADWVTAKLIALFAYIGLGVIALRRGKTKTVRTLAFIAALAIVGYILAVAITHSATPWA